MARALTPTLLSLSRWASIIGINPVHFAGAKGENYFPDTGDCEDIWPQWNWQGPTVIAREDLAHAIHDAELDIEHILGFPVAPRFIAEDVIEWPHYFDRSLYTPTRMGNGRSKVVNARYGKLIAMGRRATSVIRLNAPIIYEDLDGDGFDETAKVTVTTAITNTQEIKVYFGTRGADPAWEIRPISSIVITSGTAVIRFPAWLALDPILTDAAPTHDGYSPIDIEDAGSYEATVDVYREYVETTNSVTYNWTNGTGCDTTPASANGSATIRNADVGHITPTLDDPTCNGEVDNITVWYKAGVVDERYKQGLTLDPLSDYWAQAIVWLATARLRLPVCACGPVQMLVADLQRNILEIDRSRNTIFSIISPEMITNPFGSRVGEVRAWDRVARVAGELALGGGAW